MKILSLISFEKIISFFFFINITFIYSQSNIHANYPRSILLQNGKLFILNAEGIFLSDADLTNYTKIYQYEEEISKNVQDVLSKSLIEQFPDEKGIIICIMINQLLFFEYSGALLNYELISEVDYSNLYHNLLTYKKEGDYYYYIVTYIHNAKIFIFYYKVASNGANELISNKSFTPFYLDYPEIEIYSYFFSCQIMNSGKYGDVLTCCFQTKEGYFYVIQSFEITQNFKPIGDDISFTKIPCPLGLFISTSISNDRKNLISFYRGSKNHGYSFIYNIDQDKIIKNQVLIANCLNDYNKFKLFKSKETNEFIFICATSGNDITIMRMKDENDFRIVNKDSYSSPNYFIRAQFNFFNLLYDNELQKYKLMIDPTNGTSIFTINTDFNNRFPGGELPEPLIEDPPCNHSVKLREDNKYFIFPNETDLLSPITINEKDGIIIDFFDGKHFIKNLNQDKELNKSLYAMDIDYSNLKGQLKYVLENGEEKEIIKDEKLFWEFKIKYIPPEEYFTTGLSERFSFKMILKNFSIASNDIYYSIIICANNCSCSYVSNECNSCAENYSHFKVWNKCYANSDLKIGAFYDEANKVYQSCYEKCKTCNRTKDDFGNMHCLSCYEERDEYLIGTNCYEIKCEHLFYKDKDTLIKTCINESTCPDDYPILNNITNECKLNITEIPTEELTDVDLTTLHNDSFINETIASFILDIISRNKNISSDEFTNINQTYKALSSLIQNKNISNISEDIVIKGKDAIYQITTSEKQKNCNGNSETSSIDLGECEKIIKRNISYENDPTPLIILKIDIKKDNLKSTLVEYEVYNPYTKDKINLDICSNTQISISAPINLSEEETSLYESVSEQGYDIFDGNTLLIIVSAQIDFLLSFLILIIVLNLDNF